MARCACGYMHAHIPHDCGASGTVPKAVSKAALSRPDNMCANCPSDFVPCRKCWVRAGYDAGAYDDAHRRIVAAAVKNGFIDTSMRTTEEGRRVMEESRKREEEMRSGRLT